MFIEKQKSLPGNNPRMGGKPYALVQPFILADPIQTGNRLGVLDRCRNERL